MMNKKLLKKMKLKIIVFLCFSFYEYLEVEVEDFTPNCDDIHQPIYSSIQRLSIISYRDDLNSLIEGQN